MKIQIVLMTLVLAAGGTVFAQTAEPAPKDSLATPRIDQREANQAKRIEQGAASGQLTRREERRLQMGEARIENAETRAKADGAVTRQERKHLTRMENKESKAIYQQKRDRQRDMDHDGKRDRAHAKQ